MPELRQGVRAKKSRLANYLVASKGAAPKMPEIKYGAHLIEWLQDAGVVDIKDGRLVKLSFAELQAWASMTGRRLTWWEAETLAKMSESYASWSAKSGKADCPSPLEEQAKAPTIADNFKSIDTKKLKRGKRRG